MIFVERVRHASVKAWPSARGVLMSLSAKCRELPEGCDGKEHLRRLLNEALELADRLTLAPEIGARLQEVIDMIDAQVEGSDSQSTD
jgi:hypothetical protein